MVQDGFEVWVPVNVSIFCQCGNAEICRSLFTGGFDPLRERAEAAQHTGVRNLPGQRKGAWKDPYSHGGSRGSVFADRAIRYINRRLCGGQGDRAGEADGGLRTKDLPGVAADGSNVILCGQELPSDDGVADAIRAWYPRAAFIRWTIDRGAVCTCMLAEPYLDPEQRF